MLEQQGKFNDLSPKLRTELENQIAAFGKSVRFKFKIDNPNPDPLKYNGPIIWPFIYTLQPKTFQITDPYENREGHQKVKTIALVDIIGDANQKTENRFKSVKISEKSKGILYYDLESIEQQELAMYCLLHPKFSGGKFMDKSKIAVFSIVDEMQLATEQRTLRSAKLEASIYAAKMSDKEVVDFADAMSWDSTEEPAIIRNKIEDLAENTPEIFNDLVTNDKMKFQTTVKQALDNNIISYEPVGNQMIWCSTKQPIMQLSSDLTKNEVERAALWFQLGGEQATKVFDKVKSLLKKEAKVG